MTTIGPSQIVTAGKYADLRERARGNGHEPRFIPKQYDFSRFFKYLMDAAFDQEPPYEPDSRSRDTWLQKVRYTETLMIGVINAVTLIDANRGWQLTGGRNTVRKWSDKLHQSANGQGWRHCIKKGALSFWTTDMGAVFGIRRPWPFATGRAAGDIQPAPADTLENIDPAACFLTYGLKKPDELNFEVPYRMLYNGQPLYDWDYFRVASMPSDVEGFNDLGFCALSRALEFVKLMFAVWRHDQEMLGARMPKGILILNNISESQWETAMDARKDKLSALEREVYGGVQVLSNAGPGMEADAKLVALSSLPVGWDQQTMANMLMYGYACAFGYDPREFWPVSEGSLGTGRETATQAEKASTKGQMDFALGFQERLQDELPDTLHFEFEERDDAGALVAANVKKAQAEAVGVMSQMRENTSPVLTNDEVRQLLAQDGLIPDEWTLQEEQTTVTDEEPDAQAQEEAEAMPVSPVGEEPALDTERQRLLDLPEIRRACEHYWNEPIVRREVRYRNGRREARERILWASGDDALGRRSFPVYKSEGLAITREDIARAVSGTH